ncbi:neurogenic locus notch homolog protein 3 isoform X1 [Aplysia californica]|uniref:Neurogenic locus notch homolog protein 3 isoform X1 n=1 Tax=Aplysia californica TaxID=6500 RepID=A0ABM1A467_APLCA|nr:neurogenic locus notch homolog protein 3 isoform X1 [Aplysia californica]
MCQNVPCGLQQNRGACLASGLTGSHARCVCAQGYIPPDCHFDPCVPTPCDHGGVCQGSAPSSYKCFCPLGFSGQSCSTVDPDPQLTKHEFSPQLFPPSGSTIQCEVHKLCDFPVYSNGNKPGSVPNVRPGPSAPGVDILVNPTEPDNSTSLPGFNYVTQVSTKSPTPGQKSVCVQMDDGNGNMISSCYSVLVIDPAVSSTPQPGGAASHNNQKGTKFLYPTPPDGSKLPCADPSGCHLVVATTQDPSGNCSDLTTSRKDVYLFNTTVTSFGACQTEVLIIPNDTTPTCFQARLGDKRCFSVPLVPVTGQQICQSSQCGTQQGGGACLPTWTPSNSFDCVCAAGFLPPDCLKDPCFAQPCFNGGICHPTSNTSHQCFCPLGFSDQNCSVHDPDPAPTKPLPMDKISPTNGGQISCVVNVPCTFPVYTQGKSDGSPPVVGEGPKSPDITVTIQQPIKETSTAAPGHVFSTPITTESPSPGLKELCVNISDSTSSQSTVCFNIDFKDQVTTTPASSSSASNPTTPKFEIPTLPSGSKLPCADGVRGCHMLVYIKPNITTGNCPSPMVTNGSAYAFNSSQANGLCVTDIVFVPDPADPYFCLQAGFGETRCYSVPLVGQTGPALCAAVSALDCGLYGSCLAQPQNNATKCVCQPGYNPPTCEPVSRLGQCYDRDLWRKAFREGKVRCTCRDLVTGQVKTVVRPRVPSERLWKSAGIGAGTSTSALLLGVLLYQIITRCKNRNKRAKARQAHDYLFQDQKDGQQRPLPMEKDGKPRESSPWKVLSCFHCGDVMLHVKDPK